MSVLADYEALARHTDDVIAALPTWTPTTRRWRPPWFEPGARWLARRVLLHVIEETTLHAGHADTLRESIDRQKTMG